MAWPRHRDPPRLKGAIAMPQAVEFDKGYAELLLDRLDNGGPLVSRHPDGRWNHFDMLLVAGLCLFGASSHGSVFKQPDLGPDQQARNDGAFMDELHSTVAFLGSLFAAVLDDEYDSEWEPTMQAVVTGFPAKIQVVSGKRP